MAIAATIGVHLVLLVSLLQLGATFTQTKAERLVAVDLRPAPPPPPPSETSPPPPRQEIVAVRPPIELPRPTPIAIAIEPDPAPAPRLVAPSMPRSEPAASPPTPAIVDSSDLGTRIVSGKPPRYPTESRRKREQGTVVLAITLGLDGKIVDIAVSQSSGFRRLDKAALEAVRRWRWAPTVRDGQAVMVRGVVPIPFVLQEQA